MRFLSTILVVLMIVLPRVAMSQVPETIELEHDGHPGYWFADETATKMLKDLKELKLVKEKLALIDTKLELKDQQLELLREDIKVTEDISDQWQIAFKEQAKLTQMCEEEKNAWYKSPLLWGGVGLVVGVGITIGIGYALAGAR